MKRHSSGITLIPEGLEFLELCKQVIAAGENTQWMGERDLSRAQPDMVTIAGPTFLLAHLVAPHAARALKNESLALRLLDIGNTEMLSAQFRDQIEAPVHCDSLDWPATWKSYPIGTISWVLCAGRTHPLGSLVSEKEVAQFLFVIPTILGNQGFRFGRDHCPIPEKNRLRGAEVRTSETTAQRPRTSVDP